MNWISIHDGRPLSRTPVVIWTKNNKFMVTHRKLDEWFIDKFSVTHWMIVDPPAPPDWVKEYAKAIWDQWKLEIENEKQGAAPTPNSQVRN